MELKEFIKAKRVWIIGGSIIAKYVYKELSGSYEVLGVLVRNRGKAMKLANKLKVKVYNNLDEVIEDSPDYIIEAAAPNVLKEMGIKILGKV